MTHPICQVFFSSDAAFLIKRSINQSTSSVIIPALKSFPCTIESEKKRAFLGCCCLRLLLLLLQLSLIMEADFNHSGRCFGCFYWLFCCCCCWCWRCCCLPAPANIFPRMWRRRRNESEISGLSTARAMIRTWNKNDRLVNKNLTHSQGPSDGLKSGLYRPLFVFSSLLQ